MACRSWEAAYGRMGPDMLDFRVAHGRMGPDMLVLGEAYGRMRLPDDVLRGAMREHAVCRFCSERYCTHGGYLWAG